MTDKVQKIRDEVERLYNQSLADENRQAELGLKSAACTSYGKSKVCKELLSFIDSMQEEPVSIWYDGCEIPESGANILMIRKDEEDSNYPPVAGCFHGTNSRLNGRNWGYYNGFCYNEIEPPLKWAYVDDLLNLSNVERTEKNRKEEPKPKKCMFTLEEFTEEDRKVLCEDCDDDCEYAKKVKPVSEELEEASLLYYPKMSRISEPHGIIPADNQSHYLGDANEDNRKAFKAGAQWQKEQDKQWLAENHKHIFAKGRDSMEQQMIKNAVSGLVTESAGGDGWVNVQTGFVKSEDVNVKFGDKIKIIVVKED